MLLEGQYTYSFDPRKPLGSGPFGKTYLGRCTQNGQRVRIRFRNDQWRPPLVLPEPLQPPLREVLTLPNGVVVVIETFVEGEDLKSYLARVGRPLQLSQALLLASGLCHHLQRFHELGWVHGDVKPSNILIPSHGCLQEACLIDLDTAAPSGKRLAPYSFVYAPPELLLNQKDLYGPHGDLFSLAVVLWEALTGEPFLQASHPALLLQMQISRPMPAHPRILRPLLKVLQKAANIAAFGRPPQMLAPSQVRQALSKAISLRYHQASSLLQDLFQAAGESPAHLGIL